MPVVDIQIEDQPDSGGDFRRIVVDGIVVAENVAPRHADAVARGFRVHGNSLPDNKRRRHRVVVSMSDDERARLDSARGDTSRSAFLRAAIP